MICGDHGLLGIAACNIGGVTIHSFSGIGLGDGTVDQLVTKIRKNRKAAMRWAKARVLIIDEGMSHFTSIGGKRKLYGFT